MSVTFLPETCAACSISFLTRLRFASILITTSNQSISAWQIQPDDPAVRSLPNLSLVRAGSEIALTISRNSGISNFAVGGIALRCAGKRALLIRLAAKPDIQLGCKDGVEN